MANETKKERQYDPNEDYSRKIAEAAEAGDYAAAARYEQQRNAKILGEGLTQYQTTNQYAKYLPKSNQEQMADILQQLQNRERFSYDLNGDALYQQYKDHYLTQGKLAMQDTMGQAAALTGGYGNSYAQTVGQQAYQSYLSQLDDVVPELYQMAYERYAQEDARLRDLYQFYADRENQEYERAQDEQTRAAQQQQTALELALSMLRSGIMPSDAVLTASGLSTQDAAAIYNKANAPSSSGGGTARSSAKKAVPMKERLALAEQYEQGGDSAIASSLAAYKAQGYDSDELLDWLHTYYTYREKPTWWRAGLNLLEYTKDHFSP